jgi:hypothetical protein
MKKILFLITIAVLASCKCLSQIPPQYIYPVSGCEAPLPDYLPMVTVSDNCAIESIIQTPSPGFMLTGIAPVTTVIIKATDKSGNISQIAFNVVLKDTIAPIIIPNGLLLVDAEFERIDNLYNRADLAVIEKMKEFDQTFPYEGLGIPRPSVNGVGIDSVYFKNVMLSWTARGHAITGEGARFWTFPQIGDTLIFNHW